MASTGPQAGLLLAPSAHTDKLTDAIDTIEACFEIVDYGGGVFFAEQIPADAWLQMFVIDASRFARGHIPCAINVDQRQVLAKRNTIPRDKPALIYCNIDSLSALAGFALRVAGWENLRIQQRCMEEWTAKGGGADARVSEAAKC